VNDRVPKVSFDVSDLAASERLAAFSLLTQSLYECVPASESKAFDVRATGYHVADQIYSVATYTPASFRRDERHLRSPGSDFLVLEAQLAGEQRLAMEVGPVVLLPQHIHLRDWACGFESEATAMSLLSLVIPRSQLQFAGAMGLTNPVVAWSMESAEGRLLLVLWRELLESLERVTQAEAERLTLAFVGFVDGLLSRRQTRDAPVTLAAMQQFLIARLRGDVGVADLCRHFHVSRSTVYRLFEPVGGVLRFLNAARLERCRVQLRHADPERDLVGEIAASWGYSDASDFSRRFRTHFGVTPSAVLGAARFMHSPELDPSSTWSSSGWYQEYMSWFNRTSGWD
jgi:AraC-like DNA-binding protein